MPNTSSLTRPSTLPDKISFHRETFPPPASDFEQLFEAHGMEVRSRPFKLDFNRYADLDRAGRLVWMVARHSDAPMRPVGYSCHFWYRDLHFDERCAADDLWYVLPDFRRRGIGRQLKEMGHAVLHKAGVTRIGDNIRMGVGSQLLHKLGFEPWGIRWIKTYPAGSGN